MKRTYIPALYCCECGNEVVEGELQYKYHRKQVICAQCLKRKMDIRRVSKLTVKGLREIIEEALQSCTAAGIEQTSREELENRIAFLEAEVEDLKAQLS